MESHLPAHPLRSDRASGADPRVELGPDSEVRDQCGPGLYVHVPFCAARCGYCDFASGSLSAAAVERYLSAIEREIAMRAPLARSVTFRSVFFGGGTPSALSTRHFARLARALRGALEIAPDAEITLEVNPESAKDERLAAWRALGVNRLSFGVQSFHDDELESLGRLHDARQAADAFRRARRHGYARLSFDLMFGFPGHAAARWAETLDRARTLEPAHLSAYAFIVEAGTPLGNAVLRGDREEMDGDTEADLYAMLVAATSAAGLRGYETSNFARPGDESRHNLGYWLRRPYLAFGPSAHGLFAGERWANHWSLERWAESLERGLPPESEREREDAGSRAREAMFLALRLGSGLRFADYPPLDAAAIRARYGEAFASAIRTGRLAGASEGVRIPAAHRFVADDVIAWIEARASRAVDRNPCTPIIPSPCPSLRSPAA